MGIAVKKGDVLILVVNGIAANTIRANVGFRPDSWWHRVIAGLSKLLAGGTDPHNLTVDVVSTTDRSAASGLLVITEDGEIDTAMIENIAGTMPVGPGEIYAWLRISRSDNNSAWWSICRGYIHQTNSPVYPWDGGPAGPFDGPGRILNIATADPAAGSEVPASVVPTNARWKTGSLSVQLVQGITQTPLPTLRIRNSAPVTIAQIPITTAAIGASSTAQLTWAKGIVQSSFTAVVGDEFHTAPLPDVWLAAGSDFSTITDGIGANTNYGPMLGQVEEWIDP